MSHRGRVRRSGHHDQRPRPYPDGDVADRGHARLLHGHPGRRPDRRDRGRVHLRLHQPRRGQEAARTKGHQGQPHDPAARRPEADAADHHPRHHQGRERALRVHDRRHRLHPDPELRAHDHRRDAGQARRARQQHGMHGPDPRPALQSRRPAGRGQAGQRAVPGARQAARLHQGAAAGQQHAFYSRAARQALRQGADGRPDQRIVGLGERDRGGRAAGSRCGAGRGQDQLRQGVGPDGLPAQRGRGAEADDRAILHAVGPQHPQGPRGRRGITRRRRPTLRTTRSTADDLQPRSGATARSAASRRRSSTPTAAASSTAVAASRRISRSIRIC